MRNCVHACVAASLSTLAACGAAVPLPEPEPMPVPKSLAQPSEGASLRLMVKLEQASVDPRAIAATVSAAAGVPARHLSATSPQWHAVVLECTLAAHCESAWQRLQSGKLVGIESVQRDERRRGHAPS